MKYRPVLALVALFATAILPVLTFTGQVAAQTAAPGDEAVVSAVKSTLAARPDLKAGALKITSKNGEVTLAGDVEDGQALYNISLAVQKVDGVKVVINEMSPKH